MKSTLKTIALAFVVSIIVGVGFKVGSNAADVGSSYVLWHFM